MFVTPSTTIQLGEERYGATRAKLRLWIELEEWRDKIKQAADSGNTEAFASGVYSYISAAIGVKLQFDQLPWYEVIEAFGELITLNKPLLDFPLLRNVLEKKQDIPWDYEGRTWYLWFHMLAAEYGWRDDYIAQLDVDTAMGLAQEIAIQDQLRKEWEWATSPNAYEYDSSIKKHKFRKMERPTWMRHSSGNGEIKKTRIPIKMLPVGIIIRDDEASLLN